MNRFKQFARRWGAIPSIVITVLLGCLAVYLWWAAEQVPPNRPNYISDPRGLRATMLLFGGFFVGMAALVNAIMLASTRLPWRRVARIGSVVNVVVGVLTIPALIGILLIYNGVVGLIATTPDAEAAPPPDPADA